MTFVLPDTNRPAAGDNDEVVAGPSGDGDHAVDERGVKVSAAFEGFDGAEGRSQWYTPSGGPPATRSIANWDDDIYLRTPVFTTYVTGNFHPLTMLSFAISGRNPMALHATNVSTDACRSSPEPTGRSLFA